MSLGLQTQVKVVLLVVMNTTNSSLKKAIKHIGNMQIIADSCRVTHQAVSKWRDFGFLPQSEIVGSTNYGKIIETLCNGYVTHNQLLDENRAYRITNKKRKLNTTQ